MKYILKPLNQLTCEDWGAQIGVKVDRVTTRPDGTIELEVADKDKATADTALANVSGMKLSS